MSLTEPQAGRSRFFRHPAIVVWAVLMLVTGLSWCLSGHQSAADAGNTPAFVMVLGLAFIKVLMIGEYFMELRHAPAPLRLIFVGWVVTTGIAVIALYLRT